MLCYDIGTSTFYYMIFQFPERQEERTKNLIKNIIRVIYRRVLSISNIQYQIFWKNC